MAKLSASAKIWLGVGVGLVLFAGLVWLNHWRAKKTLQTYKARLVAQGERLGIDELAPPAASHAPTFGVLMNAANRLRGHALDPAYFLSPDFIAAGQARAPWQGTNLAGSYRQGPVTWAQVTEEMESARDDLDAIHAALHTPAPRSIINYHNVTTANVVAKRGAAQWLALESIERLHRNDLVAAQAALLALPALARVQRDDLTLVDQMIRAAIAGLAFDATSLALQMPGWTEPQLAELQSQWQQLELFEAVSSAMEMERARALELFERARTNGLLQVRGGAAPPPTLSNLKDLFEERVVDALWPMAFSEQDELFYLEALQRQLEALRRGSQHKSWRRLSVELTETSRHIESRFNAPGSFRFSVSGRTLGNWLRAFEHVMRQETQRSLMLAAIALQRYQLRYRKLPPNLDSLVPEFLAAVPTDYMNGAPLHYRVERDGSFRLYSVGLDGKDDGGNPQPVAVWRSYSSIFDGRDAVWPRLASSERAHPHVDLEILPLVQFDRAPLPDVIEVLARQTELHVQVDPSVKLASLPPVTIRLTNMTALDVLEAILKSNRLVLVKHPGTNCVGITKQ